MQELTRDNTIADWCLLLENYPAPLTPGGEDVGSDDPRWQFLAKHMRTESRRLRSCPYCSKSLQVISRHVTGHYVWSHRHISGEIYTVPMPERWVGRLLLCQNCGYWQTYHHFHEPGAQDAGNVYSSTKPNLQRFETELPEGCHREIAKSLRINPQRWYDIDPISFEKFVGDVFRANYERSEVIHVGQPSDGGVDLYFIESSGKKWAIQVKRRARACYSEGVGTLRNLMGAMIDNDNLNGIFVSTCDHFTLAARQYAERNTKKGYVINLIDRGKLDRMLDNLITFQDLRVHVIGGDEFEFVRNRYSADAFLEFEMAINRLCEHQRSTGGYVYR